MMLRGTLRRKGSNRTKEGERNTKPEKIVKDSRSTRNKKDEKKHGPIQGRKG